MLKVLFIKYFKYLGYQYIIEVTNIIKRKLPINFFYINHVCLFFLPQNLVLKSNFRLLLDTQIMPHVLFVKKFKQLLGYQHINDVTNKIKGNYLQIDLSY